jgi:hypothetical protein
MERGELTIVEPKSKRTVVADHVLASDALVPIRLSSLKLASLLRSTPHSQEFPPFHVGAHAQLHRWPKKATGPFSKLMHSIQGS